jgi:Activator of Hsp90 ATPase homolog 1-like protein
MKPEVKNYHAAITAKTTTAKAFEKINDIKEWWAKKISGNSQKQDDVFTVHFGETFVTFKLIEVVPDKKVVWLVTNCYLHWIDDKTEWNGTKIVFEISEKNGSTKIDMTHIGLVPGIECYKDCKKGWDGHIKQSLYKLITMGKGMPE